MALRLQIEKQKKQEEMRRIMAERKKKNIKPTKIDNPLAKYNNTGQLMCILCNSVVRSEHVWQVHMNSKQHRENVEKAKQLKELTNNFTVGKIKHKSGGPLSDAPPEKRLKGILKNAETQMPLIPKNTAPQVISFHDEEIKRTPLNLSTPALSTEDVPATSTSEVEGAQGPEQPIPEGFFDDPILDAKTKGVPLAKDEVALLIDLVEANKVITSKATNATNNQLKEAAWSKLTDAFNASISSCPRRTDQLKLKWENLKKTARKRSTKIRMNQIKTGGGKADYIPPDDALDRVASILGATCEGYSVSLGGDAEVTVDSEVLSDGGGIIVIDSGVGDGDSELMSVENESGSSENKQLQLVTTPKPKKFFFNTPSGNNINKQKRRLLDEDVRTRAARNQAIADYYIIKRKKLELELENMELTNRKLKLDLEQNK